jgi:uncharacterized membrane protein YebE (DUF533 family)
MDIDVERLIGSVLRGTLTSGRKRGGRALRYAGRKGSLLNARNLLMLAGVAWGLYETASGRGGPDPGSSAGATGTPVPPPLPAAAGGPAAPAMADADAEVVRVVRLAISAARADGAMSPGERERILAEARAPGAADLVAGEIDAVRPLAEIVRGVSDPRQREALYHLAFVIVRADEGVSGAERIYLAQLAHALGLDPATTARIETESARAIDATPETPGDD